MFATPGYLGNILQALAVPLMMDGLELYGFCGIFIIAVILRITFEERILSAELPGYSEYMRETKRLIPFVY
jgi:protein-S-isoprenylcysteine O-methyltransferase Ste14